MSNIDRMKVVKEEYDPEHTYTFEGDCVFCKKKQSITVRGPELFHFRKTGRITSFQSLSLGNREFLISGMCEECWDETFPPEEGEDGESE